MPLDGNPEVWPLPEEEAEDDCITVSRPDYLGFAGFAALFIVIGTIMAIANLWEYTAKLAWRFVRRA